MAAKINGEIYMTLADGLKFCKPPNGCSVQCGSIFALPSNFSDLQMEPDDIPEANILTGATTLTYSAVPFLQGSGFPIVGSKAVYNGNEVPISGSDVTITLVSGTWQDENDPNNTGKVIGFTYDPSLPQFTVTVDSPLDATKSYDISLQLQACEVECPENCKQYNAVVTAGNS